MRACRDCPADISARPNRAVYCLPCAAYRRRVRGNWLIGADPDRQERKAIAAAAVLYENGTKRPPRIASICPDRESGGTHDFADVSVRGVLTGLRVGPIIEICRYCDATRRREP